MSSPIDFYFDFSSPYGYLAAQRIDALAGEHGREVNWWPYLMGAVMQLTGAKPLTLRGDLIRNYAVRDMARSARQHQIPFQLPSVFPVPTVAAGRAYWWLRDTDAAAARDLAKALYSAYFAADRNIQEAAIVLEVAAECGVDRQALETALQDEAVKTRLKDVTNEAIERGVFGSPYFIVDGEPFWGNDRIDQLAEWLRSGGW